MWQHFPFPDKSEMKYQAITDYGREDNVMPYTAPAAIAAICYRELKVNALIIKPPFYVSYFPFSTQRFIASKRLLWSNIVLSCWDRRIKRQTIRQTYGWMNGQTDYDADNPGENQKIRNYFLWLSGRVNEILVFHWNIAFKKAASVAISTKEHSIECP